MDEAQNWYDSHNYIADKIVSNWVDNVVVAMEQALQRQREEIVKSLRMRKKRRNKHDIHEIDDGYCIQCQGGVKVHPEWTWGYNQAVDEFNKKLDELTK